MNPISEKIQQSIQLIIESLFTVEEKFEIDISIPKDANHGNLSSSVPFQLSKKIGRSPVQKLSPVEIADKIIVELNKLNFSGNFTNIAGYINYRYSNNDLVSLLKSFQNKDEVTSLYTTTTQTNKSYSLEYISPNSTKSLHIGHLMNACLGKAIYNLLINAGAKVRREILFNDRGIGMGKLMYAFEKYEQKDQRILKFISENEKNNQPLLDTLYLWGSTEYENDQEVQTIVSNKVLHWETEMTEYNERSRGGKNPKLSDFPELKMWEKVRNISLDTQNQTIKRLKCDFDKIWYESNFFDLGQAKVTLGLKNKIFRESDGAILSNLKSYNLTDTIIRKKDGTALYITQDLALAELKKEGVIENTHYIYVVGNEQKLALQQVFAISDQLGITQKDSFTHISYPFILLKGQGKMSSRKGNTVFIDKLIDEVKIELNKINSELNDDDIEKLALAAIKFSLLKYSRTSEINFDIQDSINTSGFSAIYIMYVYVRTFALLDGIEFTQDLDFSEIELDSVERDLLIEIQNMKLAVLQATKEYAPNKICYSMYEIANKFNKFYTENRVLDAEEGQRDKRLLLVKLTNAAIEESFKLLGIDVIQRM